MAVVIEDNFSAYTVGVAPTGAWTVAVSTGGAVIVDNDPQIDGTREKVLKLHEAPGSTADHSEAILAFGASKNKLTAVFEVYPIQGSKTLTIGFYVGATRYDVLRFSNVPSIQYKNSSGTWTALPTPFTYPTNTSWTKVRVVIDKTATGAELVQVTVNEVDRLSSALDLANFSGNLDSIIFATDDAEDNATFWIDNVQIMDKVATVQGTVTDEGAAPLNGARIWLYREPTLTFLATTTTNISGVYSFTLDSGIYVSVFGEAIGRGGAGRSYVWVI